METCYMQKKTEKKNEKKTVQNIMKKCPVKRKSKY